MTREDLCLNILKALAKNGVDVQVLHGVSRNGTVGRDVDVWIEKAKWELTFAIVFDLSRECGIEMARINSPVGLRFLFFENEPTTCGFLEFHCVRSLKWFWVGNPVFREAAPPYKRFVLPLLAADIGKLPRIAKTEPLEPNEEAALRADFRVRRLMEGQEIDVFFGLVGQSNFAEASRFLRKCIFARTMRHPFRIGLFLLDRVLLPLRLFLKPCGLALIAKPGNEPDVRYLAERKGVLTDVRVVRVSEMNSLAVIASLPKWIVSQGRQRAVVYVVSKETSWIARLFRTPVPVDAASDPIPKMNESLKLIVSKSNRQFPHSDNSKTFPKAS